MNPIKFVESIIFNVKWLLLPFYFALIIVLCLYSYTYTIHIIELVRVARTADSNTIMLGVLEAVDMTMVANLVKMIITGSYHSFINKHHAHESEKISSGMLKIKMGMSIIGVSSIHLLYSFIDKSVGMEEVIRQSIIHGMFLVGTLAMAVVEYLHVKIEKQEIENEAHSESDSGSHSHA